MDGQHFDDLTQRLISLLSRRRFGQALATIGVGGLIGMTPKAKAKKKKKKCKSGAVKCSKKCVDPNTNPSHCGGCNRPCSGGAGCVNGACQGTCQPPNTLCNGECVDTETDDRFCGSCTTACLSGQDCVDGACEDVCTPACPSDRPCYRGKCTCTGGQCQRDQDPDGNACVVNPPGRPDLGWCGCSRDFEVCAAGEACSFCCVDGDCGDSGEFVCAVPPAGAYRSRICCVDLDSPCDSHDDCCSGRCNLTTGVCVCAEKDAPCGFGRGCCSDVCAIPPGASGKCL
jgi:hypothetical protein